MSSPLPRTLDLARRLADHQPGDAVEAAHLVRVRAALVDLADPFSEEDGPVHVTGSAILLPRYGGDDRTVLHLHKRLGRWLQPGGHVDPGETAQDGALREAREETGLDAIHPADGPRLVHVHVHDGGRGHTHLDTRWLLFADPAEPFAPAEGESDRLGWFEVADLAEISDGTVTAAVAAARRARVLDQHRPASD